MTDKEETTHELLRLMIRELTAMKQQLRNQESKLTRTENRIEQNSINLDRLTRKDTP